MKFIRWLYPLFLGIVTFNIIRLVTDIPNQEPFWGIDSWQMHLQALLITIIACYLFNYLVRISLKMNWFNSKRSFDTVAEYICVTNYILISTNLILYLGNKAGLLYFGNPVTDYIVVNVVQIPVCLLYYTVVYREYLRKSLVETELNYLNTQHYKQTDAESIIVKSNKQLKKIGLNDILFIQSMENYVIIHTIAAREVVYSTLKHIAEALPAENFLQVHRSYIVNTKHITAIEGNLLHIGISKIPVARNYRERIFELFVKKNTPLVKTI
ncbi:MAG: LytTR family transcriptional regulator [Candidatus Symbiothrix sp.]|jgi:hypothetical protein|nr:LytTR family transcriptional regulator [Candidatus Symbiothrix sp.]